MSKINHRTAQRRSYRYLVQLAAGATARGRAIPPQRRQHMIASIARAMVRGAFATDFGGHLRGTTRRAKALYNDPAWPPRPGTACTVHERCHRPVVAQVAVRSAHTFFDCCAVALAWKANDLREQHGSDAVEVRRVTPLGTATPVEPLGKYERDMIEVDDHLTAERDALAAPAVTDFDRHERARTSTRSSARRVRRSTTRAAAVPALARMLRF